jgi:hypothetical protein
VLLQPIDPEALTAAVRPSLATVHLGQLEPIKVLPGMVRAAVLTLINETLSRTVAPVKQFLGLLV